MSVLLARAREIVRRLGWRLGDRLAPGRTRPRATARLEATAADVGARHRAATDPRLRVGFVVCDRAKWSAGPVFDALRSDPGFDCGFYLTLSDTALRQDRAGRRMGHAELHAFYEAIGPIWGDLYEPGSDRMGPLSTIDCDVAFVQQPWGMQDLPRRLTPRILSAYIPYTFALLRDDRVAFDRPDFHGYLWRHFAQTEANADLVAASTSPGRPADGAVVVSGYPKLDVYRTPAPARDGVPAWPRARDTARRRIAYAPHHAIGTGSLGLSTIAWSGPVLERLATAHSEIDFVLKPHPNPANELARRGPMSRTEIDRWMEGWRTRQSCAVVDGGNYFDLFRTSDLLITDSASFLAEYLPTGRPIVRMLNPGKSALNAAGAALETAFYAAHDTEGLDALFRQLVLGGEDPLLPLRASMIPLPLPLRPGPTATEIILQELRRLGSENRAKIRPA